MKRLDTFFGILCLALFLAPPVFSQNNPNRIDKVVIDAGHGGEDPGAVGKYSKEKDIVLAIALKTGEYIEKNIPGVEVIFTRTTDRFIELYKRAQIANENHADLFISVHCNSNPRSSPYGAETYVMGLHKSEDNLEVAKLENASILLESDYSAIYDGFDPNSDEAYIVFSLYQNVFLDHSLSMAVKVQDQFRERVGRHDRGVKQAGFLVLYRTTMPGVLIETGFLSNPEEEKFLRSQEGQVYIASAIYRAFKEYKNEYETRESIPYADAEDNRPGVRTTPGKPETDGHSGIAMTPPSESVPASSQPAPEFESNTNNIYFRVQFYTSPEKIPLNTSRFSGLMDVREYYHGGLYKYTSGNEHSLEDASRLCTTVRSKGFRDAFVVAFESDKRIDVNRAIELKSSGASSR